MWVHMLGTYRGSPDGFKVARYHEGKNYNLPDNLARCFIANKQALPLPDEDFETCVICLESSEYVDENGMCGKCEWHQDRALKEIKIEKVENSSKAAYFTIMNHIGNIKAAKALGWL